MSHFAACTQQKLTIHWLAPLALSLLLLLYVQDVVATEIQTFSNASHAALSGWAEFNSRDAGISGNNFGFSATNNTTYPGNPAGEAGGVFARTPSGARAYYADTTLDGPFDVHDTLFASGELYLDFGTVSYSDGHPLLFVGFFNKDLATVNQDNAMGILLNGNRSGTAATSVVSANAYGGANTSGINPNGSSQGLTNSTTIADGVYRFEMTWTPYMVGGAVPGASPGNLSVQLWNSSNTLVANLANALVNQNRNSNIINAFGFLEGGTSTINPGRSSYFIDNLEYTSNGVAVPEPASWILAIIGLATFVARSRSFRAS